ncbi:prolyl oligopeptidase family serine peptidase [Streptomyces sp. NBC_00859]|uniref:S9 family peptidase n=1 Tax=Streptomyces sp. NBC_00859 TaxID=2903682 RepID=UPI003865CBD8|nr:prolyl oligopeptidase family serine peptidase [Streptomyces sp. NBC_00859]
MTDFRSYAPLCRFKQVLVFSPDGNMLACSSNFSGQYNVWLYPVRSGAPRQLTRFTDHAVRQIAYSPDGLTLAFSADHHGGELRQLYLIPVAGGDPTPFTDSAADHCLAASPFSPDGKLLVYAANDRDPSAQDIVIRDLSNADHQRFVAPADLVAEPVGFSPDGRQVLVRAERATMDTDLYLLDLSTDHSEWRCLTSHQGRQMHHPGPWGKDASGLYRITDAATGHLALVFHQLQSDCVDSCSHSDWDVEEAACSSDGSVLAWVINEDGRSVIRVRHNDVDLPSPAVPSGQIRCLTMDSDGRTLAFQLDQATRPTEVCVVELDGGGFRYLTDNRPAAALSSNSLVDPELIRYVTHDGRHVPAYIYRPRGEGPFPVVLSVHGGPEEQERPVYRYAGLYQYLVASGIAVMAPNVRGSTGYGAEYQRLIHRDWGGAELGDLEYAALYLHAQPWADPQRLAVFGGSYGGFAALSCLSKLPDYWAAGVSVMGPTNLVTFLHAAPATWRPLLAEWVGDPELDAEMLRARSPMTDADRIESSLFLIQGAKDRRVSKAEGDQLVSRLRARGVDIRYDVYEDEGHGFTKRQNELQAWSDVGYFLVGALRRRTLRAAHP